MHLIRLSRMLALAIITCLTLPPSAAWGWGDRASRSVVVIRPQHPLGHHQLIDSRFSTVIVINEVIVVEAVPKVVWVPSHWHWNGFGWVVVGGHWTKAWCASGGTWCAAE